MLLKEGAVYIDSPIPSAVHQVAPFFNQGVFSNEDTPLFMRRRAATAFGLLAKSCINRVRINTVTGGESKKLPVRRGGAVFYTFNGQGNLHTVANRSYRHVLVLHGESNKRASARPAARLYDYVCVAGQIAIDRYVSGGIFRQGDVAGERLIQVGDTFIQSLEGYSVNASSGEAVLYAPTWEGYGGAINDYSSITMDGLAMVEKVLRHLDRNTVVIRPHPYLGLLKPGHLAKLIRDAVDLSKRFDVRFDLSDSNPLVKTAVLMAKISGQAYFSEATGHESLAFCVCDVSAMEAICLKEHLPHFVLMKNFQVTDSVKPFYARKAARDIGTLTSLLPSYASDPSLVDDAHRQATFSVSHPDFLSPSGAVRRARLLSMVSDNAFWS